VKLYIRGVVGLAFVAAHLWVLAPTASTQPEGLAGSCPFGPSAFQLTPLALALGVDPRVDRNGDGWICVKLTDGRVRAIDNGLP